MAVSVTYPSGKVRQFDLSPSAASRDTLVAGFLSSKDMEKIFTIGRARAVAKQLGLPADFKQSKTALIENIWRYFNG